MSEATVDAGGETDARDPRDLQAMVPRDVASRLEAPVLGHYGATSLGRAWFDGLRLEAIP